MFDSVIRNTYKQKKKNRLCAESEWVMLERADEMERICKSSEFELATPLEANTKS